MILSVLLISNAFTMILTQTANSCMVHNTSLAATAHTETQLLMKAKCFGRVQMKEMKGMCKLAMSAWRTCAGQALQLGKMGGKSECKKSAAWHFAHCANLGRTVIIQTQFGWIKVCPGNTMVQFLFVIELEDLYRKLYSFGSHKINRFEVVFGSGGLMIKWKRQVWRLNELEKRGCMLDWGWMEECVQAEW